MNMSDPAEKSEIALGKRKQREDGREVAPQGWVSYINNNA